MDVVLGDPVGPTLSQVSLRLEGGRLDKERDVITKLMALKIEKRD